MAYATFNASGSDKMSWMNVSRLVNSSWNDVQFHGSDNLAMASLEGIYRFILQLRYALFS